MGCYMPFGGRIPNGCLGDLRLDCQPCPTSITCQHFKNCKESKASLQFTLKYRSCLKCFWEGSTRLNTRNPSHSGLSVTVLFSLCADVSSFLRGLLRARGKR